MQQEKENANTSIPQDESEEEWISDDAE